LPYATLFRSETRSCGTGTVAAAVSALADAGAVTGKVVVNVPGGKVQVEVREDGSTLRGPAESIATGLAAIYSRVSGSYFGPSANAARRAASHDSFSSRARWSVIFRSCSVSLVSIFTFASRASKRRKKRLAVESW